MEEVLVFIASMGLTVKSLQLQISCTKTSLADGQLSVRESKKKSKPARRERKAATE